MTMLQRKNQVKRQKSAFREYAETIIVAVTLMLVIRTSVVQAYRIPSGSMEDTLLVGDFLLANKAIYGANSRKNRVPYGSLSEKML